MMTHDAPRPQEFARSEQTEDIATLFSHVLPLGAAPTGLVAFKVHRPNRPNDLIVDAGDDE